MAVITAGLYRVDLFQTYVAQEVLNTFWYRHGLDANDKTQECADAFNTVVLPEIAIVQHVNVAYTNIKVAPVFGTGTEVNKSPTTTAGLIVGDPTVPFLAASIRLNRSTNEQRHGWKRFCGLAEGNITDTVFGAAYFALLVTLADELTSSITEVAETFFPQIVRKPFSTKAMSPNWEAIQTNSGLAPNRQTTQNTRKPF